MLSIFVGISLLTDAQRDADLAYLHDVAREVLDASRVAPAAAIPGMGSNTTGFTLRVPGGTLSYYPAFWVRDAAMMLGADFVPTDEIEGWVRVVAATQAGPSGLSFPHGLVVPPYSIPDHITLQGAACWYPGAYTDQGNGTFGHLPPADDAFYFIQMAFELCRRRPAAYDEPIRTGWGEAPLAQVCDRAFDSVAADATSGLVACDANPERTRVDWGFCDSIRKTGQCLMPSLLRWQAARRLADLERRRGRRQAAAEYGRTAATIARGIVSTLYHALPDGEGRLDSATGLGAQDDVWASAFAVWLGILPRDIERRVARHLLRLSEGGVTVRFGQVRQLPGNEFWQQGVPKFGSYQNGGYWATPTGWLVAALAKVDRQASDRVLHDYAAYVRVHRAAGAPYEWIDPVAGTTTNANYASSAGLVYISAAQGPSF